MNFDYLTEDLKGKDLKTLVNDIINTGTFQRLQHIDQMGMASAVYPTALHTRYAHSLGTAYLCLKVLDRLDRLYLIGKKSKKKYKKLIDGKAKKYAFVAALLHDIGHGPFSHAFERLLGGKDVISHEDWTEHFFGKDKDGEVFSKILREHGLEQNIICDIILGKYGGPQKKNDDYGVVADIVSSQLDVDRMDYLLRDSYFTGIAGCKIDLDWILNHFVVFTKDELHEGGYKDETRARLGIAGKGADAVAHMLLIRGRVYSAICHHKKICLLEELLVQFLRELMCLVVKGIVEDNPTPGLGLSSLGRFLRCCDDFITDIDQCKCKKEAKKKFMEAAYPSYKTLTDYDIWMVIRDFATKEGVNEKDECKVAREIARCIYTRNLHKALPLRKGADIEAVREKIKYLKRCSYHEEPWKLQFIETKLKYYNSKDVYVRNRGQIRTLDKVNTLIDSFKETLSSRYYVMVDKDLLDDEKRCKALEKELGRDVPFGRWSKKEK